MAENAEHTGSPMFTHRVYHTITDPRPETLVGKPKLLLTADGVSLEFKIRGISHEWGDGVGEYHILALGEVLDRGKRFDTGRGIIAHGMFAFSNREYHHGKDPRFHIGILAIRLGNRREGWLESAEKDELFVRLRSWMAEFEDPMFKRLTGMVPEIRTVSAVGAALTQIGNRILPLVRITTRQGG